MKLLFTLMITFQFISAPFAAELGEHKSFSARKHLYSTMAQVDAHTFEALLRKQINKTKTEGFVYQKQTYNPIFKETSPAHWEYQADGNKVSFTSADIYEGQLKINGKILQFRDVPLDQLEKKAEKLLVKKTSFLEKIYFNTFGIQEAQACELVCGIVIVVIAAAIVGKAVYELMIKPEKMVERLNEMKNKLESDAVSCEEAKNDQKKYEATFFLASAISDRSALGSVSSSSEALEYAMKKQLQSGSRSNEDCFKLMNEVGKKVDVNIPIPTERQIQMRELAGARLANEKVDVANAAFNLCTSFNRLGSCMENFVASHVNDSDIDSFKDSAEYNHYRFKRRTQGSAQ